MKMIYKKLCLLLALSMATGATSFAQQEQIDEAAFAKIRNAELTNSHIPEIAHYLTDVSGPRLPGSEGFNRAATWAVATMKKWGLANAAMEPYGEFGKQWELEEFSIALKVPYYQPLRAYPEPWCGNTNGVQQGTVVLLTPKQAADTTYLLSHSAEIKGKFILLAISPLPTLLDFRPGAERLTDRALDTIDEQHALTRAMVEQLIAREKARIRLDIILKQVGVLGRIWAAPDNVNGTIHVQAGIGYKLTDPVGIPKISMSYEDGKRIKRLIQSGHPVELAINIQGRFATADTKGYNVVGEIPGTDPKLKAQLVMLGGHLDSWQSSTGATDNAAGCVVVLEAMRLLDSLGLKPKRTIRVALWTGEEQGIYGSFNYVKNHFMKADGTPNAEQSKVSAYFNMDYGTGKVRGIYAQGNKAIKPIFEQWFAPFHDLGATTVTIKSTGSTDHLSFDWAGIPGFQFIQDPLDEDRTHHTDLDDYDHLAIEDLKQSAIIVASFVYQSAIRPELLPRKPFIKDTFLFDGL
ncbi:M20/M25/M40 family metallo-hydrolase [Mucilaginibacter sp.]|uniref:M20/M25/M40 family metallo-hydrolase n=1 Tax=Mucilaginibacter sp. TaxID=1882438 RepID=UPI0025E2223D|nr:M20/M25/M40 family metallo-hydrolase [Mucilaginibacter sp.]